MIHVQVLIRNKRGSYYFSHSFESRRDCRDYERRLRSTIGIDDEISIKKYHLTSYDRTNKSNKRRRKVLAI